MADPEIVKDILIKDFHIFVDHNDFHIGDVLNERSLFNMKGEEWKLMRAIVSQLFCS